MGLSFTKMHGAGNDFVVIDATRSPFAPRPELLQRLTDRRYGVGCDQVLVVEAPGTADVDFDYRIFNADGSEVGQCGNGARCLAAFVRARGLSDKDRLRVRTQTRVLELEHLPGGSIRANLGAPRFAPPDIPLTLSHAPYVLSVPGFGEVGFEAVSMGNPHAVIRVDDVASAPVTTLGPVLQQQPAFPASVNVGFLEVQGAAQGRLRVYERGVGETLACGSGACAAAVAGRRQGWFTKDRVSLQVPGGTLVVEWPGDDQPVWLTGPVETVFQGELM